MSATDAFVEAPVDLNAGAPDGLVPGLDTQTQAPVWIWCDSGRSPTDDAALSRAIAEADEDWQRHEGAHLLVSLGCHSVRGRPAWVFERFPGDGALIGRRADFAAGEVLRVAQDLASALMGLHEAGLTHGDVRPGRLVRGRSGTRLVPNFERLSVDEGDRDIRAGETPPECHNGAPPTPSSDLYGIGVVMLALWPGVTAWDGATPFARIGAQRSGALALTGVPSGVARLVRRLVDPDPMGRPGSARHVHGALQTLRRRPTSRPRLGPSWLAPVSAEPGWLVWGVDPQHGWPVRFGPPMDRWESERWVARLRRRGWQVERARLSLDRRDVGWIVAAAVVGAVWASALGAAVGAVVAWAVLSRPVDPDLGLRLPPSSVELTPAASVASGGHAVSAGLFLLGTAAALQWAPWLAPVGGVGFLWCLARAHAGGTAVNRGLILSRRFDGVCGEIRLRIGHSAQELDTELGVLGELQALELDWERGHRASEEVLSEAEALLQRVRDP